MAAERRKRSDTLKGAFDKAARAKPAKATSVRGEVRKRELAKREAAKKKAAPKKKPTSAKQSMEARAKNNAKKKAAKSAPKKAAAKKTAAKKTTAKKAVAKKAPARAAEKAPRLGNKKETEEFYAREKKMMSPAAYTNQKLMGGPGMRNVRSTPGTRRDMIDDYREKYAQHRKANPGLYKPSRDGAAKDGPTPLNLNAFGSAFSNQRQRDIDRISENFGVPGGRIGPAQAPFGVTDGRVGPPQAPFGVPGGRIGPAMPPSRTQGTGSQIAGNNSGIARAGGPQTNMANRMARSAGQPLPNPFAPQEARMAPQAPPGYKFIKNQRGQMVLVPE